MSKEKAYIVKVEDTDMKMKKHIFYNVQFRDGYLTCSFEELVNLKNRLNKFFKDLKKN